MIMVSMSGYGADGPHRDWVAYGANIETTSSLTSITGYPDGQLSRTTLFYADPVSGNYAARGDHGRAAPPGAHRRGPVGRHVAQRVRRDVLRRRAPRAAAHRRGCGRRWPTATRAVAPQGVYRCIGTDNWVALTVRSAEEWKQVADAHRPARPGRRRVAGHLAGRHARHDELDAAISAWTAGLEQYEVAEALQAAGVAAGAGAGQLADPARPAHLRARHVRDDRAPGGRGLPDDHVAVALRAHAGAHRPARPRSSPSTTARSSREAGLDDDAIAALYESGTTADEPTVA